MTYLFAEKYFITHLLVVNTNMNTLEIDWKWLHTDLLSQICFHTYITNKNVYKELLLYCYSI